ncbi:MAG: hypothetical protein JNK35_01825 [Phycisphaerae bacterium]|nr:hypothetical protein [Phycisphaerae bacterium]
MKKLAKRLFIAGLLLVVLVVGGVVYLLMSVNALAKKGIEAGGTYALGVPTTVDSVSIGLLSGQASLANLNVANPQGFASPHFLKLGGGSVAVSLGSLQSEVVEIPSFALSNIDVRLERKGDGGNYQKILDNLKSVAGSGGGGGGAPQPAPSGGPEKRFIVRDLTITNVRVELDMLGAGGAVGEALNSATKIPVSIDKIELKNVGKTGEGVAGSGVTMGQLASIIVQAVLSAAAEKGGGLFPADVLGDLQGRLTSLGGLKDLGMAVSGQAGEAVKKVEETVKGVADEGKKVVDEGKKAVEDVKKGIEGLIPGKKKDGK